MTSKHNKKFYFHPNELAFCGFSKSGKTTLIESLIGKFSKQYSIGYYKHDAHSFQMDKEGKDTERMSRSGAKRVLITDPSHSGVIDQGNPSAFELRKLFIDLDFLFLEGNKRLGTKKVIVLDEKLEILKPIEEGEVSNILFYVGPFKEAPAEIKKVKYFHRDDITGISQMILSYFQMLMPSKVFGLVLTGGQSRRMKKDKATLCYKDGKTQAETMVDLLKGHCDEVFVSSQKDQWRGNHIDKLPQIFDTFEGMGPMGGILSAQSQNPEVAWLVVACDLPFLNSQSIEDLLKNRNPFKYGTCFLSANDGLPEPLCALYEPKSYGKLLEFLGYGYKCPRKVLINSEFKKIELTRKTALENMNHPHEFEQAVAQLKEINHENN